MLSPSNAYVTVQWLWIDSQVVGRCLTAHLATFEEGNSIRDFERGFNLLLDEQYGDPMHLEFDN
jgi:hypothetical protein